MNASLAEQLPTLSDVKLELARKSLIDFTGYTFPKYQENWHHRLISEHLDRWVDGDIRRLMIFLPPRYGKSELVSRRMPAYILGKYPDTSIIATSYTADLARMMNRDVQRIIDSPEYSEVFPGTKLFGANVRAVAGSTYLRNSDIFEVVNHRGVYKNSGVGGAITGLGAEYVIIDDPIKNREEAESITYRNRVYDWYTSTLYTRLEKDACILLTMTRWHEDDLAGRLLEAAVNGEGVDQWTVLSLPSVAEEPLHPEDPRKPGDPLWPDKYPLDDLVNKKATMGSYDWGSLHQQNPTSPEGSLLKREWWQYYKQHPAYFDEIIQSWDCTFKDTDGTDFVVGQVWGKVGADKYLLDQVRARMDMPTTMQAIRNMTNKWPQARAKLIEDKANGPAVIAMLKKEISGLIPINPEGGKVVRVQAVSADIEAGNVYLPQNASWLGDFVEECAGFPNARNDDQVDAMSQALNRFIQDRRVKIFDKNAIGL